MAKLPATSVSAIAFMMVALFLTIMLYSGCSKVAYSRHALQYSEKLITEMNKIDAISVNNMTDSLDPVNNSYSEVPVIDSRLFADREGNGQCVCGHIEHFVPVCGGDGCLRTLAYVATVLHMKDRFQEPAIMSFLNDISGWCDVQRHAHLARDISVMQWQNNIYGSVGEIGVYMGKYSAILGFLTNTELGEHFFAADIFENTTKVSQEQGRFSTYIQTMERVGFSIRPSHPSKKLHLYFDSSMFLSKLLFVRLNLPAFRLLSIDGGHLRPIVLSDFEKAVCIMRKGGIIIFDDAFNPEKEVNQAIRDFFDYYGSNAFKSLLYTSNKLFVCTSDFYPTFMAYIRTNIAQKYNLQEQDENAFVGNGHRYFSG